jgi:hypothetical protein
MSEIRVPYRDRDDSLADLGDLARAMPAEDRAVVRGLVLEAAESGMSTAGQVIDALEGMSVDERRRLRDRARERAGMPAEAAARNVSAPLIPDAPPRDAAGCAIQICAAKSCGTYPVSPYGATVPVNARRWWCEQHRAGHEDDMEPWTGARIALGPSGFALIDVDEVERESANEARAAKRRADQLEQRRAQRIQEWSAMQGERAAQADQFRRATLPGAPP